MITLTSIDYARLIQFTATKMYQTLLNKTQVNKILFYIYGVYLAKYGKPLFADDTPKVWVYGPVFPRPNKRVVSCEMVKRSDFSQEKIDAFQENNDFLSQIVKIVGNMRDISAISLTRWSHEEGSPWDVTLYKRDKDGKVISQSPWNTTIPQDCIKEYFSNPQNQVFG